MEDKEQDVKEAVETQPAEASTADQNTQEVVSTSSEPDVKQAETNQSDKKVPYERFAEKNNEAKYYKELYEQVVESSQPKQNFPDPSFQYQDIDEQQQARAWAMYTEKTAEGIVERKMREKEVRQELRDIAAKEDFALVAEDMKRILKEKPFYSPADAYKLAKADKGLYEEEAKAKLTASQKQQQVQEQKADMGPDVPKQKKDVAPDLSILNKQDKSGKFEYSLDELKEMLSKNS